MEISCFFLTKFPIPKGFDKNVLPMGSHGKYGVSEVRTHFQFVKKQQISRKFS